ncbi:MAG: hypothetical protein NTV79_00755, partial [Candidatus Aureabacteria bacterium]|nr:hypothetical protein [Candidatus Auribacterota bacterium]
RERAARGIPQAALMLSRLPICNRLRTRPGWVEPEVYFRIVHLSQVGHLGALVAPPREQTVEIALGPNGTFENSNIGALTRRVSADTVVSAAPSRRGRATPPKAPKTLRVVELLRKAIEWRHQLDANEVRNQAEIASREGITRARVTQIMGMLRLAPEIQDKILTPPSTLCRLVTERMLRPIGSITDHRDQLRKFRKLHYTPLFSSLPSFKR